MEVIDQNIARAAEPPSTRLPSGYWARPSAVPRLAGWNQRDNRSPSRLHARACTPATDPSSPSSRPRPFSRHRDAGLVPPGACGDDGWMSGEIDLSGRVRSADEQALPVRPRWRAMLSPARPIAARAAMPCAPCAARSCAAAYALEGTPRRIALHRHGTGRRRPPCRSATLAGRQADWRLRVLSHSVAQRTTQMGRGEGARTRFTSQARTTSTASRAPRSASPFARPELPG